MIAFLLLVLLDVRWLNTKKSTEEKKRLSQDEWMEQPISSTTETTRPIAVDAQYKMVTNDDVAKALQEQVRVLCWIAVTSDTKDRALIVKETWGRRCTKFLMIGDEETTNIPNTISLNISSGRKYLWPKTREAFRYIYENHFQDADWFLKADTDSYYIMENLRYVLAQHDLSKPAYLGCEIQLYVKEGYNSGGAGYVLNKESLSLLVNEAYKNDRCHKGFMEDEDVSMGYCMSTIGVKPGDPTDSARKNRFFPFEPADHVSPDDPGANGWYWRSTFKPGVKNMSCCSDTWISFHYVSPKLLWNMEFLLYHSKIFGVSTFVETSDDRKLN